MSSANKRIIDYPELTVLQTGDYYPVNRSGTTYKVSVQNSLAISGNYLTNTLPSGQFLLGNVAGVSTPVRATGDVFLNYINGSGVFTINPNTPALTGKYYPLINPAGYMKSGDYVLYDLSNVASVAWAVRGLYDQALRYSVDWENRILFDSLTNESIDWNNRLLLGNWNISGALTGAFYPLNSNPAGYATSGGNTGALTGTFYPLNSNPSGYITTGQTGAFGTAVNTGQLTGAFYPRFSNPSGYTTGIYQANSLFVSPVGNNSSALRGRMEYPFLTISGAVNIAKSGDCIFVLPGTYTENNLSKNWVNYYFYPGSTVTYTENSISGSGYGIFDDRNGVINSVIGGKGNFYYYNNTASVGGNYNVYGLFLTINSGTTISFEANDVGYGALTPDNSDAAFEILNCKYVDIKINRLIDLYSASGTSSLSMGLYWKYGETHFHANYISFMGQWGVWADEDNLTLAGPPFDGSLSWPVSLNATLIPNITTNLWCSWDFSESPNYISVVSPNIRTWWNIKEINTVGSCAFEIDGAGKHYIIAEKLEAGVCLQMGGTTSNYTDLQVWLTVQKLSSSSRWMNILHGSLWANIGEFEDLGIGSNNGIFINIDSGNINIHGQTIATTNCNPIRYQGTANSKCRIQGYTIDTSAASSTGNMPVYVIGSGLSLDNCKLITAPGQYSIYSTTSAKVQSLWTSATTGENSKVTLSPNAGFYTDSNLF